jgi:hypothetical protein
MAQRKALEVKKVRRYQKRRKSRRVEAPEQDWAAWDAAAAHMGLTWSEFARRAMNALKTSAIKLAGVGLVALLLVGCGGASEDPLECSAAVVATDDGDRLLVSCSKPVENPPEYCEPTAIAGAYMCNIFHASADDCATFPGICGE